MFYANRMPGLLLLLFALLLSAVLGCSSGEGPSVGGIVSATSPDNPVLKVTVTSGGSAAQPETVIEFSLPKASHVFFEVTNATGYHVRTLIDRTMEAGAYAVSWDGTNDNGEEINPGIYVFHLVAGEYETWQPVGFAIYPSGVPD